MSHAGSWRAACRTTIHLLWFHFEAPSVARGVTDPGVGSGVLLGRGRSGHAEVEKHAFSVKSLDAPSKPLGRQDAATSNIRDRLHQQSKACTASPRLLDSAKPSRMAFLAAANARRRIAKSLKESSSRAFH